MEKTDRAGRAGCSCRTSCPEQCPGERPCTAFASFFIFEKRFENGAPIPWVTGVADPTGSIVLTNDEQIDLLPGYYYISYSVATVLEEAGYLQVTPSVNGTPYLFYGAYFKESAGSSSATGANTFILHLPVPASLRLTCNSSVANRAGAATLSVLKLAPAAL